MLSIGTFSRVCQVSVKTLHHYDRIGLLPPAEVDPYTGYRYYRMEQIDAMNAIQRLKRYGFSLEEIQRLMALEDDAALAGALRRQMDRLERVPRERVTPTGLNGARYYDEEFNREASDIELFVGIREREKADVVLSPVHCAATVHRGGYSSLSEAYGAVVSWIAANGYAIAGAPFELYVKTQFDSLSPEDWLTEIYFPVKER